ncbi:MAG: L-serine ammonia-lyase, iron-sulfur-dependent, subunit alpha [Clostridiales bacterium]|nr:L-serine ammonia-lyase, iron-sulfur-dependent, subunit alpha [Clostridiales bacterium]MDO4351344.1 L-serine ammonia-lyase, iron-sulfur-dependent, subunit alpha [Eubacteriales bacterium]MDY4009907.1 L-serine ammonia-lyase, iron-sulfur-dependent, subunit alpha [Candidatus Limiplasma sp.]
MQRHDQQYQLYCAILRRELAPATGCTEPIALAYCAALARHTLGAMPQRVRVQVSGNIIKNVKSVTVPNTGGLKGIQAAVAAGVVAGNERAGLEVIHAVTPEKQREIAQFLAKTPIAVEPMENCALLDMIVTVYANGHEAGVRISHSHTHVARIERDGQALLCGDGAPLCEEAAPDYGALSVEGICEFASILDTEDVREVLDRQIACNTAIAAEGLKHRWGADIGNVLLETYGSGDVRIRARAMAAAGSDARMSGCEMPVVINSGSGNQGLTVSLPVIEYARAYHKSQDDLYRALAVSNLCAIHQKNAIGKLSAYCGAVTAGSAAGAGVAYLLTGDVKTVCHTIVNALAIVSGIVCDGAKPSCAGKIASAVDAGILGLEMYLKGRQFYGGDGIISKGIENTIRNVGELGRDGMRETDRKILQIMTRC